MPTSDINSEMIQAAEYAVRIAKEKFGQDLDFSETTLLRLEKIIEQAHQQFINRKLEGKAPSDAAIKHTANVWGSYLGEIIRRKWGGSWIFQENEFNRAMAINDTVS